MNNLTLDPLLIAFLAKDNLHKERLDATAVAIRKVLRKELHIANPDMEAWRMLEHIKQKTISTMVLNQTLRLTKQESSYLKHIVYRRCIMHEPLQYILGVTMFLDHDITCIPPTLIPRAETQDWLSQFCQEILAQVMYDIRAFSFLDMCSGSGCISIALAHIFYPSHIIGADISPQALALANLNKIKCGFNNLNFIESDLFSELENKRFDFIVSNPPYLSQAEFGSVCPSVGLWEDKLALLAGNSGLEFYEKIIPQLKKFLTNTQDLAKSPRVALELGIDQQKDVCKMLQKQGFCTKIIFDAKGAPRAVFGYF